MILVINIRRIFSYQTKMILTKFYATDKVEERKSERQLFGSYINQPKQGFYLIVITCYSK